MSEGVVRLGIERQSIPGLDPLTTWTARLSARSALFTELQGVLDGLTESISRQALRSRVVDENMLARASASARAKLWKELRSRYVLDQKNPLFAAFWGEWTRCGSPAERALTAYLLFVLNDRLAADLGLTWLYPLVRQAPSELRVGEVELFIERGAQSHPEVLRWSPKTRLSVAQHYLASVRDFGLARGVNPKITVRPALYGPPTRLLLKALRLTGRPTSEVVQAPEFRLLGIAGDEAVEALQELSRLGELQFRMQGDVIDLEVGA